MQTLGSMKENKNEYLNIFYHNPSQLEREGGIWLLRMGESTAKPNYSVGPRFTDYYSVHFILEGEMILEQSEKEYYMKPGDMFCIFPHTSHKYYHANPKKPLKFWWISIKGQQASMLLKEIGLTVASPHQTKMFDLSLINHLTNIAYALVNTYELEKLKITQLLYHLFQKIIIFNQSSETISDYDFMIEKGIEYMEMHYSEGILVQDVVYYLENIERSQFTKMFKKSTGKAPQEYLLELRMSKARNMLLNTTHKITDIALSLGYPNLYTFSRTFKKYHGTSPSCFRETKLLLDT